MPYVCAQGQPAAQISAVQMTQLEPVLPALVPFLSSADPTHALSCVLAFARGNRHSVADALASLSHLHIIAAGPKLSEMLVNNHALPPVVRLLGARDRAVQTRAAELVAAWATDEGLARLIREAHGTGPLVECLLGENDLAVQYVCMSLTAVT